MIGFIVRIALALSSLGFNIYLFASGHWGWGISFIFITALIIASFFDSLKISYVNFFLEYYHL
jgi:hypothetical protein